MYKQIQHRFRCEFDCDLRNGIKSEEKQNINKLNKIDSRSSALRRSEFLSNGKPSHAILYGLHTHTTPIIY